MSQVRFESRNPFNDEVIESYATQSFHGVSQKLENSKISFTEWRRSKLAIRSTLLEKLAEQLEDRKVELAIMMAKEMGKPVTSGQAEVEKSAALCRYYSENLSTALANKSLNKALVSYQPLGPILGIMPWNFPIWQVIRFAVPTIAAGNTVLIKHSDNVTGCALLLDEIFNQIAPTEGIYQSLVVTHQVAEQIIVAKEIKGVSLTGSVRAGKRVASLAGGAMKPCLMELGGSDPYIVLNDADPELAARSLAQARLQNSGQTCIAAKRIIVENGVMPAFLEAFTTRFSDYVVADPLLNNTKIGPLAKSSFAVSLRGQRDLFLDVGASVHYRSPFEESRGALYPPEILLTSHDHSVYGEEELFGPVALVINAENQEEAISIANNSSFGLGAGIFTSDTSAALQIAEKELIAGNVAINGFVSSRADLPFGGIGDSGFGRELGTQGLHAFCNIKSIQLND